VILLRSVYAAELFSDCFSRHPRRHFAAELGKLDPAFPVDLLLATLPVRIPLHSVDISRPSHRPCFEPR
jgi:hypothetical protein